MMASMVGQGRVVALEDEDILFRIGKANVQRAYPSLVTEGRLELVYGSLFDGYAAGAPYDCIHSNRGTIPSLPIGFPYLPPKLVEQLAPKGKMVGKAI